MSVEYGSIVLRNMKTQRVFVDTTPEPEPEWKAYFFGGLLIGLLLIGPAIIDAMEVLT